MLPSASVQEATARALIDDIVRPLVVADGGTVDIVEITETRIHLRLGAACAGCPGRTHTRAQVIEPLIRSALGPDVEVQID